MRYIVGLAAAGAVTFLFHLLFGIGTLPRPWGSLAMGTVAGLTIAVVLYIWEVRAPHEDRDERDRRLKVEEAAKDEARELRRSQKAAGTWNTPAAPADADAAARDDAADAESDDAAPGEDPDAPGRA